MHDKTRSWLVDWLGHSSVRSYEGQPPDIADLCSADPYLVAIHRGGVGLGHDSFSCYTSRCSTGRGRKVEESSDGASAVGSSIIYRDPFREQKTGRWHKAECSSSFLVQGVRISRSEPWFGTLDPTEDKRSQVSGWGRACACPNSPGGSLRRVSRPVSVDKLRNLIVGTKRNIEAETLPTLCDQVTPGYFPPAGPVLTTGLLGWLADRLPDYLPASRKRSIVT